MLDHRVRVAIKHNALLVDLPEAWLAETPAHVLSAAEMELLYADCPRFQGLSPALARPMPAVR
jgi:hypothetical protein